MFLGKLRQKICLVSYNMINYKLNSARGVVFWCYFLCHLPFLETITWKIYQSILYWWSLCEAERISGYVISLNLQKILG